MKKLMTAVVSAAAMACIAEGVDSNTVGFQNFELDLEAGQYCLPVAPQFTALNLAQKWTFADKIFENDAVEGDQISNFDPELWDMVSWVHNGFTEKGECNGWIYSYNDAWTGDPIEEPVASFDVDRNDILFFQPADGESGATIAGEVADIENGVEITFPDSACYNLVNPFPVDTTLGDLESFCKEGDTLQVFDADAWDIVSYVYNGAGNGWVYSYNDPWTGESIDDVITDSSRVVLKAGQGGYFNAADDDGRTWKVTIKK